MWPLENLKLHMWLVVVAHVIFLLAGAALPPTSYASYSSHPVLPWPADSAVSLLPQAPQSQLSRVLFMGESPALWVLGLIKNYHDYSVGSFKDPGTEAPTCGQSTQHPLWRAVEKAQTAFFCLSKEHTLSQLDCHSTQTSPVKGWT